jgi:outer membrane protein
MRSSNVLMVAGLALCICINSRAQTAGEKMTLRQCVETAIANNLDVKNSELDAQRSNINRRQARAYLLPDLSGNVSHGINQGRTIDPSTNSYIDQTATVGNYSLGSSVTLFNGFRLMNQIKQTSLAWKASELEAQQMRDNTTLSVILAYLQVLTNQELLNQSRNQADLSRKQVERLEEMNKVGAIAPSLLYDLRGQLAGDELSIINTQNALNTAKLSLAQLMNVPYNKDLDVEKFTVEQFALDYGGNPDAIYQVATQQLALAKAANLRKESAQKGVQVARGGLYPTLFLSGSLNTRYSNRAMREIILGTQDKATSAYAVDLAGTQYPVFAPSNNTTAEKISYGDQFKNNYGTSVSVGLSIPFLNAFQSRNRLSLARINLKQAEYTTQTTFIQLKQAIEQAYFSMTAAQDRYKAVTAQVNAYTESFQAIEIKFNAGAVTSVDYLVAKNNMDRANISLISVRYDYLLRTKILDYYQAKPLW